MVLCFFPVRIFFNYSVLSVINLFYYKRILQRQDMQYITAVVSILTESMLGRALTQHVSRLNYARETEAV